MATQKTATVGIQLEFDPKIHDWAVHINRLEQFFVANSITDVAIQRAILLNGLSQEAYMLLQNLCIPSKPHETSYVNIVKFLSTYYCQETIVFAERCKFYAAVQSPNERVQEWAVILKSLCIKCEFGNQLTISNILRDRFICGLQAGKVMDNMIAEAPNISFKDAVTAVIGMETTVFNHSTDFRLPTIKQERQDIHRV